MASDRPAQEGPMTDRTLKISDRQIDFIRLIVRSPDKGGGWRVVSNTLRKFSEDTVAEQPELYKTQEIDGQFMLRLSARGEILSEYLGDRRGR